MSVKVSGSPKSSFARVKHRFTLSSHSAGQASSASMRDAQTRQKQAASNHVRTDSGAKSSMKNQHPQADPPQTHNPPSHSSLNDPGSNKRKHQPDGNDSPAKQQKKNGPPLSAEDKRRKQAADDARARQDKAREDNADGTKASGVTKSGKKKLSATPSKERPSTIDIHKENKQHKEHQAKPDNKSKGKAKDGPVKSGVDENGARRKQPMSSDKQTTYWHARWLPTSDNPKGLGGGKVPTGLEGQAAWLGYKRSADVNYPRQSFKKQHRMQTFDNAAGPGQNTFTDVGGKQVDRHGTWDMGHKEDHEHWKNQQSAILGHDRTDPKAQDLSDPDKFKEDYLKPENYRPEHPSTNRGHAFEAD